nr:cornifelin homolog B-like [Nerophis lumbriciformis]
MAAQSETEWLTGPFDCCQDARSCCFGMWCCPCLACTVAEKFGENRCLPLSDILSPAAFAAIGIPLFASPAGVSLRAAIRKTYGIRGTICGDLFFSCFCAWCNWSQMYRELMERAKEPTVIHLQSPVIVQQPAIMDMYAVNHYSSIGSLISIP